MVLKIRGGVLLSLAAAAVVFLLPMSTITARAALSHPANNCGEHSGANHYIVDEVDPDDSYKANGYIFKADGDIIRFIDMVSSNFPSGEPVPGQWYYEDTSITDLKECSGNHTPDRSGWPSSVVYNDCEHPGTVHLWASGVTYKFKGNVNVEGRFFPTSGSIIDYYCGYTDSSNKQEYYYSEIISGGWYYLKSPLHWERCNNNHSGGDEDNHSHENGKHDDHDGSNDDDSRPAGPTPHQSEQNEILHSIAEQLTSSESSSKKQVAVNSKELVNALPNATMKKIAEHPNTIVFFTFTYNGNKYTTAITGANVDTSLDWYGPVYLITHYPTMWHKDANTTVAVVAPVR